jgi:hypothetical protein
VNSFDGVDTFQFNEQRVFYQHIDPVTTIQPDAFIVDRLRVLQLEPDIVEFEFMGKALLIS